MATKHMWGIGACALLLVAVVPEVSASASTVESVSAASAPVAAPEDSTLSVGDRGEDVREMQQRLTDYGYTIAVDGIFGRQTLRAVRHWQRTNGLYVDGVVGPITAESLDLATAVRGETVQIDQPERPEQPIGLQGKPFAPDGLSDCDEMNFYREQWGLPERFAALGWRESNCRNEDIVKTYCCYGYWQLYASLHLRDHRLAPRYAACGVDSFDDYNSDTPIEKQRQACAAAALFAVNGYAPWR